MILHSVKLVLYLSFGLLTTKVLLMGVVIAISGLLSTGFMKWGLTKISEGLFRKIGYTAMVLSGIVMLTQSTGRMFSQHDAYLTFRPVSRGVESKLQWHNAGFAIEFEYNEGFEYEIVIPLSEMPPEKQAIVNQRMSGSDHVVIEEVFGFHKHAYEAYFYKAGKLMSKIDISG